jgi:hypothetical protein
LPLRADVEQTGLEGKGDGQATENEGGGFLQRALEGDRRAKAP